MGYKSIIFFPAIYIIYKLYMNIKKSSLLNKIKPKIYIIIYEKLKIIKFIILYKYKIVVYLVGAWIEDEISERYFKFI